jgi:hypothetical protein
MLIKLISSAGFGTMFGGVMGLFNRKADLEVKKLELEEAKDQREHELAMRDKDAAIMEKEWAGRTQVAQIEGEAKVDAAGFDALAKSYDFAKPAPGGKMEAFSAFVRPFISLCYFLVTSIGSAWILYYAFTVVQEAGRAHAGAVVRARDVRHRVGGLHGRRDHRLVVRHAPR